MVNVNKMEFMDSDDACYEVYEIKATPHNDKPIECRHCGRVNERKYEKYRCQYCGAPLFETGAV